MHKASRVRQTGYCAKLHPSWARHRAHSFGRVPRVCEEPSSYSGMGVGDGDNCFALVFFANGLALRHGRTLYSFPSTEGIVEDHRIRESKRNGVVRRVLSGPFPILPDSKPSEPLGSSLVIPSVSRVLVVLSTTKPLSVKSGRCCV